MKRLLPLVMLAACSTPVTPPAPEPQSLAQRLELAAAPTMMLADGFNGYISSLWSCKAVHDPGDLATVTSPKSEGSGALRVRVAANDAVTSGDRTRDKERAELCGPDGAEGADVYTSWDILFPTGYAYTSSGNNYQIVGQWHDRPAPGTDPEGNSPPISFHYVNDARGRAIEIRYGRIQAGDTIQVLRTPLRLGQWLTLKTHIHFSQTDGSLEAWANGELLGSASGPNMFNAEPNYLRLGLYRGRAQTQTNTLYYDNVRVSHFPL